MKNLPSLILALLVLSLWGCSDSGSPLGVCGGTAEIDCNGDCGGTAVKDNCEVCDNDLANDCIEDCNNEWGGTAIIDNCDTCVSGNRNN